MSKLTFSGSALNYSLTLRSEEEDEVMALHASLGGCPSSGLPLKPW